jgi:hypothetical protein
MHEPNVYSFLEANFVYMVFGGVALVAVFLGFICWADRTKQRERTRREIAAYIAEGSMTAEEGERLMSADPKNTTCGKVSTTRT